ncbi:MAG: outer membrane protein OmpA-like peptidoglycan-associated protein [Bacteroidia bacterium]
MAGKGYGGMHPIADNTDPEKRALNRRVEFKVLKVK